MTNKQKEFMNFIIKYDLNKDESIAEVVNTERFNNEDEYMEVIDYLFDDENDNKRRFFNYDHDEILDKLENDEEITPVVGMGVTYSPFTDCYPYEIVKVISDKKIVVRRLDAKADAPYQGTETNLWSNQNRELVTLKKLKYGWKTDCKDTGSWSVGIARWSIGWS